MEKNTHVLVTYSADYADEFDCEGFGLFTAEQWENTKTTTKKVFEDEEEQEVGFGTNEELIFEGYDAWESCFTVTEITNQTAQQLIDLFDLVPSYRDSFILCAFGTGDNIFCICDQFKGD